MIKWRVLKRITLLFSFTLAILYPITFTTLDNLQENSQLKKKLYFPKIGRKRPARIVKQLQSGFTNCCLFRLCHLEQYLDENNHDHLLAKSYGCGGGWWYMWLWYHLMGSRSLIQPILIYTQMWIWFLITYENNKGKQLWPNRYLLDLYTSGI